jgi:transposase InsO family protein
VIEDDYSRAVAGYRLSWSAPSAYQTSLALRQAMWVKDDPRWQICGVPSCFYTDHGSDFTSKHLSVMVVERVLYRLRRRGRIEHTLGKTMYYKCKCMDMVIIVHG